MLQTLSEMQWLFNSLWVLWFFLLFGGILVWVLRPSKRAAWEERGRIPFADDDEKKAR
jgi:cytochrome c oxidase cbb3-type subunit 4